MLKLQGFSVEMAVKGFTGNMAEVMDGSVVSVVLHKNLNQFTRTHRICCKFFIVNSTRK